MKNINWNLVISLSIILSTQIFNYIDSRKKEERLYSLEQGEKRVVDVIVRDSLNQIDHDEKIRRLDSIILSYNNIIDSLKKEYKKDEEIVEGFVDRYYKRNPVLIDPRSRR